ncbi:hypothetical protein FM113_09420 [Leucobacter sp. 7(1)]|nr:hypothetical protein FM113_09420 [Leucobacter sp. 7(1)]
MRAAHELHAAQTWPVQNAEYLAAEKGFEELIARKGWDHLNRDERRLRARYASLMAQHEVTVVQHAHELGLLDAEHTAAAVRLGLLNQE